MIEVVRTPESVKICRHSLVYTVIAAISFGIGIAFICFSNNASADISLCMGIGSFSTLFMFFLLMFMVTLVEFYLQKKQEMKEGEK